MAVQNRITKVAIVGTKAGGNSGSFMVEALLKTGKHIITALTRVDSQSKLPEGVISKKVDYNQPETLVEALRGQDALIITLSGHTPKETEMQLINAAGEAGVSWILPNEWSPDTANEALVKDVVLFQPKVATRKAIENLGKSSYIGVSTGFWYDWMVAMPVGFGIDYERRTVTFFDEGEAKITTSTRQQVGRAVAGLLSLPIKPEGSNQEAALENFKNKVVYVKSFTVSQKDMLASVRRVTETKDDDWSITTQPSEERYSNGLQEMKEGKRTGFAKVMATRVFYPDGCGDVEHNKGTLNKLLGLPEEDIDEFTKAGIERSKSSDWGQSTAKVRTGQLWGKSKDDLKKQLDDLKTELGQLRTQKIAGGASSKLTKIHDLRKSIARVLTVINSNQRQQLRIFYAKKKYLPLDLRPKKTRAIRRRLTQHEANLVTEKQKKRQMHFPQRKYAVKAEV
ncbi:hypothetical protein ACLMJK_004014 [Lecanora helva]